jgi:hypothetical protein
LNRVCDALQDAKATSELEQASDLDPIRTIASSSEHLAGGMLASIEYIDGKEEVDPLDWKPIPGS